MHKSQWESLDDKEFEAMLERSLLDLPPEDVVANVNPWKKSMRRILAGLVLCTISLNFLCLNYILPAVGTVLLLLGFRSLRHENGWFGTCFIITVIRVMYLFAYLVLNTMIIQSTINNTQVMMAMTIVNLVSVMVHYICFLCGIRNIQRKVKLSHGADGAVSLIIWYAIMCMLAVFKYEGLIISAAMIIIFLIIVYHLFKLSGELDEAGYSVQTARNIVSDRSIVLVLAGVLVFGIFCGHYFGSRYTMDWTIVDSSEHDKVQDIKENLMELGFPQYVLNDLEAGDIEACEGALQVVVNVTDKFNYDIKGLQITGVGVRITGKREEWMIFHHFLWTNDYGFWGTESIQLWPAYRNSAEGWASSDEVTGRVLYDKDGIKYTAPYYFLGNQTFMTEDIMIGAEENTDVFATFSMPLKGENCRGYVAYPVSEFEEDYLLSSWVNYTHQRSWFQYPAMTAMEAQKKGFRNEEGAFITVQDSFEVSGY